MKPVAVLRSHRIGVTVSQTLIWLNPTGNAERLLIAHGMCAQTGAAQIIAAALSWI